MILSIRIQSVWVSTMAPLWLAIVNVHTELLLIFYQVLTVTNKSFFCCKLANILVPKFCWNVTSNICLFPVTVIHCSSKEQGRFNSFEPCHTTRCWPTCWQSILCSSFLIFPSQLENWRIVEKVFSKSSVTIIIGTRLCLAQLKGSCFTLCKENGGNLLVTCWWFVGNMTADQLLFQGNAFYSYHLLAETLTIV